ncbi:beta-phosphoglucomutase [Paenibacillus timonensis]|uniref:Glycoside hydrolase family 65 protein n=1 Tax=Paenibacillus timonensis TaxID=225915 RepID=A0ABW3SGA9_9BACL|nr:glycosyl hydrolase family 65 protein [Paenibacillus timonensis]MCH1642376.1 beta-phosphoglucomutase [Paenibacillus timonensis]
MNKRSEGHPAALQSPREWSLVEDAYDEKDNQRKESLFALGNGYIGMRGYFEEGYHGKEGASVRGNYVNGFYDTAPIHYPEGAYGYPAEGQAMLNVTDAGILKLSVEGETFHLNRGHVKFYKRVLHMQSGVLHRLVEWESPAGHRVLIHIRRLVSLTHRHLAAIHYEVTALNFAGTVSLCSAMDGDIAEAEGPPDRGGDPRLGTRRTEPSLLFEEAGSDGRGGGWLKQRTRHSRFALLTAMSHRLALPPSASYSLSEKHDRQRMSVQYDVALRRGDTVSLSKFISHHTSRETREEELLMQSKGALRLAESRGFDGLAEEQHAYLDAFWSRADVEIKGDPALQQGLRFNAFGLLQSAGRDGRTSMAAKGLTGEGYEGHYFWDTEMYVLPFFTFTTPEIGRALLEFRYRTLEQARERAKGMAQRGALYPWRTIGGEENSAFFPAGTAQAHINADIAYGIRQYVQATGDEAFLAQQGAEILFETSRFWVDLGHYDPARDGAFCIDGVTGPDEYTALVNNNAYTNLMAREHLRYACETAGLMRERYPSEYALLEQKIGLTEEEILGWEQAADKMYVPYDEELGIYAQDDTFLSKRKWDFAGTPPENYPLLLHYHPLVIYRHQVLKQADLVLALFLLGEQFSREEKIRNYRYYEPLTTHDSSLSPCIHSIIAAEIGELEAAYDYFGRTVRMDLDDVNGNAKDGLHTAAMAGSWMAVVNGFGGMRLDRGGRLGFRPVLPPQWESCRFKVMHRGQRLEVFFDREQVTYTLQEGEGLDILHDGERLEIRPGVPVRRELSADREPAGGHLGN